MKKFALMIFPILISGCFSNKPSGSELKSEINKRIESCEQASLSSFEKINGEEIPGENLYIVEAKFNLNFEPIKDSKKYAAEIQDLRQKSDEYKEKRHELYKSLYGDKNAYEFYSAQELKISSILTNYSSFEEYRAASPEVRNEVEAKTQAAINVLREKKKNEADQLYELQKQSEKYSSEARKIESDLTRKYYETCKLQSPWIKELISKADNSIIATNPNSKNMIWGAEFTIHANVQMKKTDNGWMMVRK